MGTRIDLQKQLATFLECPYSGLTCRVYFQPPTNTVMKYPCFVYSRNNGNQLFADNKTYRFKQRYQVTYISKNPDCGEVITKMLTLPYCSYDRHYVADTLHHDVFTIYY